ncbi:MULTISPECIES: hypothetical protein [Aphanothece]|uniref:hypothetical protein n=1 Tax=Aphanothece TaxID=1121 RepID=UPI00398487EC
MSPLSTARMPLPRLLAACGCASALSLSMALGALSPAAAQDSAPPERLTPAQKEKVFPERKALLLKQQQQRLTIQQKGQRCTQAAKDQQALRACMKEERMATRQLRSQYREEMRKIYERNGIKAPVGGPGKGKKGSKGGADA